MAHDVFISYSNRDKPVGDAVCATLEAHGIRCWIAPRDIVPGRDWGAAIVEAINGAQVMVLVFSRSANESPQIKREVERAVSRGLVIIPVRIENVLPEQSLAYFLGTPHWLDAMTPPLEAHLNRLAEVVPSVLAGVEPPPLPPSVLPQGLAAVPVRVRYGAVAAAAILIVILILVLTRGGGQSGGGNGAAVAGTWAVQTALPDLTSWKLVYQPDGTYTESVAFVDPGKIANLPDTNGSGSGFDTAAPFTGFSDGMIHTIQYLLQPDHDPEAAALFQTGGSGPAVSLEEFVPPGFSAFLSGTPAGTAAIQNPAGFSGEVVSPQEWKATLNAGGTNWLLDFKVSGSSYTFSATHIESGHWQLSGDRLRMLSSDGVTTDSAYTLQSSDRLSLTSAAQTVTFARSA